MLRSLSAYARQFLQLMEKPDVDAIDGLSPAISIEQKTTSRNPRSTVGTVTEIHDYLRLLFARVGVPYSPATGKPIESQDCPADDRQNSVPTRRNTLAIVGSCVCAGAKALGSTSYANWQKQGYQRSARQWHNAHDRRSARARQKAQARY